jgi:hypothetical protein
MSPAMQNFPDNGISGLEGLDLITPPNSTQVVLNEFSPSSSCDGSIIELIPVATEPFHSSLWESVQGILRSDQDVEATMSEPVSEPIGENEIDSDFIIHDRATFSVINTTVEQYNPTEWEIKRSNGWRDRQKRKLISALRRDIEWLVERNDAVTIQDLLEEDRIRDLTDRREDILEAVSLSQSVCLAINQGIQTVSIQ